MIVLAHLGAGHWWEILIYLAPLLIVRGTILWQVRRDRRGEGAEHEAAAAFDRARSNKRGRR
jgi:hypothetical protein